MTTEITLPVDTVDTLLQIAKRHGATRSASERFAIADVEEALSQFRLVAATPAPGTQPTLFDEPEQLRLFNPEDY